MEPFEFLPSLPQGAHRPGHNCRPVEVSCDLACIPDQMLAKVALARYVIEAAPKSRQPDASVQITREFRIGRATQRVRPNYR